MSFVQHNRNLLAIMLFTGAFGWGTTSLANASEVAPAPYCKKGERHFPNGKMRHLGGRYFRFCHAVGSLPKAEREFFTIYQSTARLDALVLKYYPTLKYNMGIIESSYETAFDNTLSLSKQKITTVKFGEAEYSVYVTPNNVDRGLERMAQGNLPEMAAYIFTGPDTLMLPEHFMSCFGDPLIKPNGDYTCFLIIRYLPSEDIYIRHSFSWKPFYIGEPLLNQIPFDFSKLIWKIRGLHFLIQEMDVTDQIDELRGSVEIIE